jgi:hypothetical protein
VDADGVDDFIMIDAIIANELGQAPTRDDIVRWAEGFLPLSGLNNWPAGNLEFPVVPDGDRAIWSQYWSGPGVIPTNVIIGADFVIDFFETGWPEDAARCCIEKNICEIVAPDFVFPSTGTRCDEPFDCQVFDSDLGAWRPVCTD